MRVGQGLGRAGRGLHPEQGPLLGVEAEDGADQRRVGRDAEPLAQGEPLLGGRRPDQPVVDAVPEHREASGVEAEPACVGGRARRAVVQHHQALAGRQLAIGVAHEGAVVGEMHRRDVAPGDDDARHAGEARRVAGADRQAVLPGVDDARPRREELGREAPDLRLDVGREPADAALDPVALAGLEPAGQRVARLRVGHRVARRQAGARQLRQVEVMVGVDPEPQAQEARRRGLRACAAPRREAGQRVDDLALDAAPGERVVDQDDRLPRGPRPGRGGQGPQLGEAGVAAGEGHGGAGGGGVLHPGGRSHQPGADRARQQAARRRAQQVVEPLKQQRRAEPVAETAAASRAGSAGLRGLPLRGPVGVGRRGRRHWRADLRERFRAPARVAAGRDVGAGISQSRRSGNAGRARPN